jgi:hypothetical protein
MKKIPWILLSGLLLALTACGTLDVASFWPDAAIKIDGRTDDWRGRLYAVEDTGVSFGVQNDDHFVYVCLLATDRRAAAQILRAGFILWNSTPMNFRGAGRALRMKAPAASSAKR